MGAPGRVELPTNGLGNRCSIHLSYGAVYNAINNIQATTKVLFPVQWPGKAGTVEIKLRGPVPGLYGFTPVSTCSTINHLGGFMTPPPMISLPTRLSTT